jgi:hypothetical protein
MMKKTGGGKTDSYAVRPDGKREKPSTHMVILATTTIGY